MSNSNTSQPPLRLLGMSLAIGSLFMLGALGFLYMNRYQPGSGIGSTLEVESGPPIQGELLVSPMLEDEPAPTEVAVTPTPPPAADVAAADVVMLGVDAKVRPKERDELPPSAFDYWSDHERDKKGRLILTLMDLGDYLYEYPAESDSFAVEQDLESRIPDQFHALSGEEVSVMGFMLPTDLDGGRVKDFLLIKDFQACCYGIMPMINEWVYVTMDGDQTAPFLNDKPIKVTGTFYAGERVQDGMIVNLYRIRATDVEEIDEIPGFVPMELPEL